MGKGFFDVPAPYDALDRARVAVISIPYERTVSYGGGASRGPRAILTASRQVELYDEVLQAEPYFAGIFSETIEPAARVSRLSPERMIEKFSGLVGRHLDAGRFPVVLGGEHTITLAPFAAVYARHPKVHVLQLDAHADLRDSYEDDPYSHACVARRLAALSPVMQIGVRSYDREQLEAMRRLPVKVLHAHEIHGGADPAAFAAAHLGDPVYLTVDLDVFDPSAVPATGTPEPGGLSWHEVDHLLAWLFANRLVIAMDLVELAPVRGLHQAEFLAARLAYRAIGRRFAAQTVV
jgi:agmatinase